MVRDKFYDYNIGDKVHVSWFGDIIEMEVIGHHEETKQVRVGHLDAQGSFYVKPESLIRDEAIYQSQLV